MSAATSLAPFHRPLGATGLTVSPLGLGTVKLGRNAGVKYPAPFDLPDDKHAYELLHTARDLGINLIDTAPAYGVAERRLARLLPIPREDWVIVTKAGEEFDTSGEGVGGGGGSVFDFSAGAITASVHRSLERLDTDYLDVVLIHSDGRDEEIITSSGAPEALDRLKQRGHIRAYGMSTKTPEGATLAIEAGADVVMVTLNPLHESDRPAINLARERGVGVLIKKALVSGHVGDAGTARAGRALTPEYCLGFALSTPGVSSVVVGTINPEHLRQNAAAAALLLGRPEGGADGRE